MRRNSPLLPYLFVLPLAGLLTFVFGLSLVRLVEFSFKQVRGIDGPWIGLRNYELVLGQPLFREAVWHNIQLFLVIPVIVVIALVLALLLYERLPGWRIHRTILFLPYVLAIPIIAVVMKQLFQFSGPVNTVLSALSLDFLVLDWIGSADVALWTVMGLILWRETALGVILFLSRLMALDETLIEAARLDGAGWRHRAWYILIPQMRGVIEFFVVISAITMLSAVFAYVYVIGGGRGGPGTATMVIELYIFNALVRTSLPGVAAAVSVMLFLVALILIRALFVLRRREED
ncbi:MAG: sugar ABC transporter permease [Rhodobacter sp.]|nr:sugar ABC transporter permease [Rhodobacter sp.]